MKQSVEDETSEGIGSLARTVEDIIELGPRTAYEVLEGADWDHHNGLVYVESEDYPDTFDSNKLNSSDDYYDSLNREGIGKILIPMDLTVDLPKYLGKKTSDVASQSENIENTAKRISGVTGMTGISYNLVSTYTPLISDNIPDMPDEVLLGSLAAALGTFYFDGRLEGRKQNRAQDFVEEIADVELHYEVVPKPEQEVVPQQQSKLNDLEPAEK